MAATVSSLFDRERYARLTTAHANSTRLFATMSRDMIEVDQGRQNVLSSAPRVVVEGLLVRRTSAR